MPEKLRTKMRDGAQATAPIRDLPNFSARRKGPRLSAAVVRKLDDAVAGPIPSRRRRTTRRAYIVTLRERDGDLFFQLPESFRQAFALRAGDTVRWRKIRNKIAYAISFWRDGRQLLPRT